MERTNSESTCSAQDQSNFTIELYALRCWLVIDTIYLLVELLHSKALIPGVNHSILNIIYTIVFCCGCLIPYVYKAFYNQLSLFRSNATHSSAVMMMINFTYLYVLSFFSSLSEYVYVYALVMLIIVALYQEKKYVITFGTCICITYVIYFITRVSTYGIRDTPGTMGLIITTMAYICSIQVTKGLRKSNHIQKQNILQSYEESIQKNTELENVKNRVKDDVISIGERINSNQLQTDHMNKAIHEVAQAIDSFAASLQDINQETVHIQSELDNVNTLSSQMSQLSQRTNSYLLTSDNLLNNAKSASTQVSSLSEEVNRSMVQLVTNISEINEMINIIKEISSQTNLLSLNASIEASRAGDSGRGFSVVAGEIRNLSESTNHSVTKIETMMKAINSSVDLTNQNISNMQSLISNQGTVINNAQSALSDSKNEVISLLESIQGVADGIHNVAAANKTVVDTTTNISAISEEISANTESIYSLSNEIAEDILHIADINNTLVQDF